MKIVFNFLLFIVLFSASLPAVAQKFDPFKGVFEKETPNASYEANINLYEKTIDGEGENTGLCYGTITITNQRGIDGYDIVGADSLESPEPNLWIVPWQFSDMDPIRVSIDYDVSKQTITLNAWEDGYIDNLTLKKK